MTGKRKEYGGIDWDLLRIFWVCAAEGSFKRSSTVLKEATSTISRKIDLLESILDAELFDRSSGGITLTAEGRRVRDYAERIEGIISGVLASTTPTMQLERGVVTIRTWESMAIELTRQLPEFVCQYPDISVHILLNQLTEEATSSAVDFSIAPSPSPQPEYVSKSYGEVSFCWTASKSYIQENGEPSDLPSLLAHRLVLNRLYLMMPQALVPEHQHMRAMGRFVFETESTQATLVAVKAGLGISALPARTILDNDDLAILPLPIVARLPVYLVYPPRARTAKRCALVLRWIQNCLSKANRPDLRVGLTPAAVQQMRDTVVSTHSSDFDSFLASQ